MNRLSAFARRYWPALIAVLAVISVSVVVSTEDDGKGGKRRTITIRVDGKDSDRKADDKITAPAAAVDQAAATDVGQHDKLKSETPVGVPLDQLEEARDQQDRLAENDNLPVVSPFAAPQQRGCRSTFVRNKSSRRGVRPRLFVMHYTVSPNRPGWSDVDAITGLFNRPSFAASSHYIIDSEGHCAYIVRESDKAWTQATANPVSISVEVINSGREGRFAAAAGLKKIGLVASDSLRRWEIPLRTGKVSGCTVVRAGIVDHKALGACGGGHVDVSPYSLASVLDAARAARTGGGKPITATDRVTCRKLNSWRHAGRPRGGAWERNSVRRKAALTRRGVTCTSRGPVRR